MTSNKLSMLSNILRRKTGLCKGYEIPCLPNLFFPLSWYTEGSKHAKTIVDYALLDICGWNGKKWIVTTGKEQHQLGRKHYCHVAKEASL